MNNKMYFIEIQLTVKEFGCGEIIINKQILT